MDPVSLTSVVLACVAIFLSLGFFWISYKISRSTEKAADGIKVSIDKVEQIYDRLIERFFSLTGETMADYRKHAWTGKVSEEDFSELVEKKADEKFEEIRKETTEKIKVEVSKISGKTDSQIKGLQNSIDKLLNDATIELRHVEKDTELEVLKDKILIAMWGFLDKDTQIVQNFALWEALGKPLARNFTFALSSLIKENLIEDLGGACKLTLGGMKKARDIESDMMYAQTSMKDFPSKE